MTGNKKIAGCKTEAKMDRIEAKIDLDKGNKFDNAKISTDKSTPSKVMHLNQRKKKATSPKKCG